MQKVLGELYLAVSVVFLDDINVFACSFDQHCENLSRVFGKIRSANLKLKASKCRLFQRELVYVGHVVSEKGISCSPDHISTIKDYPAPTSVTELQMFLGLVSFYRRFIKDFASIAQPLYCLLGGKPKRKKKVQKIAKEWQWGSDQENAFHILKDKLMSPPVLAYPNYEKPFLLRTDACKTGLGVILCHEQDDGSTRVIAYGSKSLRGSETNYSAHKLEFLALRWAVTKKFHD